MSEVRFGDVNEGPVLDNGLIRVSVHLNRGTFDVTPASGGPPTLTEAAISVSLLNGPTFSSRGTGFDFDDAMSEDNAHGKGRSLILRRERDEHEPDVALTISLYDHAPYALVRAEVTNRAHTPVRIAALHVLDGARLDLGAPAQRWRFYKEGWQDWSPALVLPVSGEDVDATPPVAAPATRPDRAPGRFLSEIMTVVSTPSDSSMLTGFISTANQFSQVWLDRDPGALTAASYADGIPLAPGQRLSSETLLIEPCTEPLAAMKRYAHTMAAEMEAVPWQHPVSGWCSWYYYWQGINEAEVLANLELISERRRELPFDYVQVDDGYQAAIGDWLTPNEKFPHGMGWLADRIHDKGLKAGLWLAPFLMGENSRLWKEHPDWAVQFNPGRPHIASLNWDQRCYALDLTHPEAIAWLENVFRTVFDDWRYDYVKIDFIYAGAVDGIRQDPNVTRAQAYRRGIEKVREIAGERFVLGCGQPIGPSVGVVNGARIGPDVSPFWHPVAQAGGAGDMSSVSTLNAIRNVLSRFWMHGSLWLNDPDCLLARGSETALTDDEVRTLATVIALSGGMVLDSDKLATLTPDRREIISMLLPVYGQGATPMDLFQTDGLPTLFDLDCGTHRMLGVFNWNEDAADVPVPLPAEAVHLYDVWNGRYLGERQGSTSVELPAHGCALLSLRSARNHPQIVGSAFHALCGAVELADEVWARLSLNLRLKPVATRKGDLLINVPEGFGTPATETGGLKQVGQDLWSLSLTLDREREVSLRFS